MKERPLIFTAESVRGILAGTKSQTRRLIKPQPDHLQHHEWNGKLVYEGEHRMWCWKQHTYDNLWDFGEHNDERKRLAKLSPYGEVGDRLWVKETWQAWHQCSVEYDEWDPITAEARHGVAWPEYIEHNGSPDRIEYRATSTSTGPWTAPLFMPRWASRLTLEIVEVRVQRLQEISEDDARAEGVTPFPLNPEGDCWTDGKYATAYQHRWGEINGWTGPKSWSSDPFVWTMTFRRLP